MLLLPSPQLMTTECVSRVPGSVKLPLSAVEPSSLMVTGFKLNWRLAGATLLTAMGVLPVPGAPSLSVTVAVIV